MNESGMHQLADDPGAIQARARPRPCRRRAGRGLRLLVRGLLALALVRPGIGAALPPVLTLAVADLPYAAPLHVAEAEGYFAAEGLTLSVLRCNVGRVCLEHLLGGKAHFATVADTPIAVAAFAHKGFQIIATTMSSGSEMRLVARRDRDIEKPADLKGKRIAIVPGTSSHYFTDTFLVFHGLRPADVRLVPLDPSAAAAALVKGEVDAAGLFEPHGRQAARRLGAAGLVLPTPRFFTLTFNLVSAGAGVSDEDARRLLRAVARADRLIHADPERARAIVARVLKLEPSALAETWADLEFKLQLSQSLVNTLEAQARWARREGLVPAGQAMPDYLDYIRPDLLRQVNPGVVRLVK